MTHNDAAERQNPEDVEETKEHRDTAKAKNTSVAADTGMVTRGRKRLGTTKSYREIAGLRKKEQLQRVTQRSKAIKKAPKRDAPPSKLSSSAAGTKQFQFFYTRTCFRGMNEWYKHIHTESKDSRKGPKTVLQSQTWKDMRKSIEVVMAEDLNLGDVLKKGAYAEDEVTLLVVTMMMLLYTHRHLKDDVFITEAKEKVEKIKDCNKPLQGLGPFLNGSNEELA